VWLASPGRAALDRARRIAEDSKKYIQKREGIELFSAEDPVMTLDDASRAVSLLKRSEVDALVIQHGTYAPAHLSPELVRDFNVPVAVWGIPEVPLDPSPLNCGSMMGLLGHAAALTSMGRRFRFVYGLPDSEEARRDLDRFVKAIIVRRGMRQAKVAVIGCPAPFDELAIKDILGSSICHVPIGDVARQLNSLQKGEIDADLSDLTSQGCVLDVQDAEAVRRCCASHAAIRKIVAANDCSALAAQCSVELADGREIGICTVSSRLTNDGIPASCEGDVDGALTMLIQNLYTGRPPFFADWVQRDEKNNQVLFGHCGSAPLSLANPRSEPKVAESNGGKDNVIFDFPLKTGDVTLARLQRSRGRYKIFVVQGRAVETAATMKGNYVNVRFEVPVRTLLDTLLKHGFPQHFSIVYEDIGNEIIEFAEQAGIEAVSPALKET